jgi:predicted nucleic acid-binding protein
MNIVVDTNILFSALYDPSSDAGRLILFALERKVDLFAPESVKLELDQSLRKKLAYNEADARETIAALPVKWVERGVYDGAMGLAKGQLAHEADVPILACALVLGHDIVSGDKHLLSVKPKIARVWRLKQLIGEIQRLSQS